MTDEKKLLSQILASTHADRSWVVRYVQLQAEKAKLMAEEKLLQKSSADQFRDPKTPGEHAAADIFYALLQQKSINWEDDPELMQIGDIAHSLMDKTDDKVLWGELLDRIAKL